MGTTEVDAKLYGTDLFGDPMTPSKGGALAQRKLGKAHQNLLVFCKDDPRKATAAVLGARPTTGDTDGQR